MFSWLQAKIQSPIRSMICWIRQNKYIYHSLSIQHYVSLVASVCKITALHSGLRHNCCVLRYVFEIFSKLASYFIKSRSLLDLVMWIIWLESDYGIEYRECGFILDR